MVIQLMVDRSSSNMEAENILKNIIVNGRELWQGGHGHARQFLNTRERVFARSSKAARYGGEQAQLRESCLNAILKMVMSRCEIMDEG
jgi:hypothetical protein